MQDFEPHVLGPVGRNGTDEEGLEFYVVKDQGTGKRGARGGAGFAIEVAGGLEVVQARFEGEFVVRALKMVSIRSLVETVTLTRNNAGMLHGPAGSSRPQTACPR